MTLSKLPKEPFTTVLVTIYYPSAQKTTAQIERTIISPVKILKTSVESKYNAPSAPHSSSAAHLTSNVPVSKPYETSIYILVTPETKTSTETIKLDD